MTINPLTAANSAPLLAPKLGLGEMWFFFSIYKAQRDYLHRLAGAHALGELDIRPSLHRALIDDLRKIHSITKRLGATIDYIYEPHISAIMAEPEGAQQLEAAKVVHLPAPEPKRRRGRPKGSKNKKPKRGRGRPKGSKDKQPRKKYKKRKATGPTVTAPDMSGAVRIQHPDGTIIKRRARKVAS